MQISAGDRHRLLGDRARVELGVARQRRAAASANGPPDPIATMPVVGLDQIAVARQQERRVLVEHDQHRLEPAQDAVGPPVLGELHGRALEIAAILLELGLEAGEQREGVGRRAGKAGQDAIVVEPADLPGALLDDGLAERDLAVARQHRLVPMTDRENRRAVNRHEFSDCIGPAIRVSRKRDAGCAGRRDSRAGNEP